MHVAINALYLIPGGVGGTEIYLRSLIEALARIDTRNRYTLIVNEETGDSLRPNASNFSTAVQPVRAVHRAARILYEQLRLPRRLRALQADVVFSPGFTAPAMSPCPRLTVFHDLQHLRHPEHFRWFDLPAWKLLVWQAVRLSEGCVAVSDATRDDLARFYGLDPAAIRVVPHGVDERLFAVGAARAATEPVVLCVSTLHPHKNIERLVRVFARLRSRRAGLRLVLAGMRGFHAEAVERQVAACGVGDAVRITGWIPREELYELYRQARVFVFPSTFEGFGMPVIEALAAGIPTACSAVEPMRSMAEGAAWLFAPDDEEAMERAIGRLLDGDLPPVAGPERARRYRWEEAARATLRALEEVAGAGR